MLWQKNKQAKPSGPYRLSGFEQWAEHKCYLFDTLNPKLRLEYKRMQRIAQGRAPILLCGENGSGKSVLALALHHARAASVRALLELDGAALSEAELSQIVTLKRAELQKTGNTNGKANHAPAAPTHLTILLKNVAALSLEAQSTLLRLLQENAAFMAATTPIAVRLIATTRQALAPLVEEKKIRQDLYYRLSTYEFELPPLRERLEDLPALLACYSRNAAEPLRYSEGAFDQLRAYAWPANLRELHETLARTHKTYCDGVVEHFELAPQATHFANARQNGLSRTVFAAESTLEISSA